jgi:type IV pilus assembly protein PilX
MQTTIHKQSGGRPGTSQRGAALVIGLLLLMVLTLLALTGMTTATTELVMAGNEQYRKNAVHAANAGIEQALSRIDAVPTSLVADPTVAGPVAVESSTTDFYRTESRYVGKESGLPQSSADKFVGLHYVIESTGTSARNARDTQVQGLFVVRSSDGNGESFGRIGSGL